MYDFEWDNETGGYLLTTSAGRFVANEIRPVFAEELELTGLSDMFEYDSTEIQPFMWAKKMCIITVERSLYNVIVLSMENL